MSYPGRSRQRRMACPLPLFGIVGRSRFYSESMLVSSRAPALPQRGVTDVTLLLAGIECRHIRRIERCALQIAFWKVRVRQERHAESDEIGLAVGDCRISEPRIVTAIGDDGVGEDFAEHRQRAFVGRYCARSGYRLRHVQIAEAPPVQFRGEMAERRERVCVR